MRVFWKFAVRLLVAFSSSFVYLFLMYKIDVYLPEWLHWMAYPSFYILGGWAFEGLYVVLPEIIIWICILTVIFFAVLTIIAKACQKKNEKAVP